MKNHLIPINERPAEEARLIRQKGARASNKAQRERKALRETLLLLLSKKDVQDNMCLALVSKATEGDVKAFETIRDTIGEKPVNVEATVNYEEFLSGILADEKRDS